MVLIVSFIQVDDVLDEIGQLGSVVHGVNTVEPHVGEAILCGNRDRVEDACHVRWQCLRAKEEFATINYLYHMDQPGTLN